MHDFFVYPDLAHKRLGDAIAGKGSASRSFRGEELSGFVVEKGRVLVYGSDDSGKTSLCRTLFRDLKQDGLLPLLVKGEDLRGVRDDGGLVRVISRAATDAYNSHNAEPYLQAIRLKKALLVDDFDQSKLSREAQAHLVSLVLNRFSQVVIFASDIFELQDITTPELNPFPGFERCTIKQFGRFHRQKLIDKWLRLGEEDQAKLDNMAKSIAQTDKTIATLLGRNVLPHHPVTILTLLQMLESREPTNTANGAYGYMYEVLIKSALAKIDRSKVDEKITYISLIGYHLFKSRTGVVSEEELRKIHQDYCSRFDMVRDYSVTLGELLRSEILAEVRGGYRFRYPYAFYYSAAKYLQDNASSLRAELQTAADHIYGDTNANVLIFYVYLTKDEELIQQVIRSAKRIYSYLKPFDLDEDVAFLNKLMKEKPPPLQLECLDTSSHRDEHNRKMDAATEEHDEAIEGSDEISYDDHLDEIFKLAIALKTMQLLGQILRNFTGSLPGTLKLEITAECYDLGMRTLAAILRIPASNLEGMRQYLGSLIAERTGITDKQKLANQTDNAIVWLGGAASFGAVKRISYAVGHVDLANTYGRVLERSSSLSTRIIDAAIKLDHFKTPPEGDLRKLEKELHSNFFVYSLMRDLVADYLYLYEGDFQMMQAVGSIWGIEVSAPKYLSNRSKR